MQKAIVYILLLFIYSCELPPRPGANNSTTVKGTKKFITADEVTANEEYVMVTTAVNLPLYVNHDQKAFLAWEKRQVLKLLF